MSPAPEILFELRGGVGFVLLNRPKALNALSLTLIEAFDARLRAWADHPAVHAVVVRGAGNRAYCAGGDIRGIWEGGRTVDGPGDDPASRLFRREYMLIRRIKVLPKPYVALILGISMIAVAEAFALGEKLGLDAKTFFDITSQASGACWAMLNHLPVPGIVEGAAANRDFKPGFAAAMMVKDMGLSQEAAGQVGAATPLGAAAAALYGEFVAAGHGELDYSAIIQMIRGD